MVKQLQLSGHKGPVTCLDHSSNSFQRRAKNNNSNRANKMSPCCLLSGSEDGTTRLWDFRCSSTRASVCIISPDNAEVTSVGFHPNFDETHHLTQGQYPFTIFSSVGSSVYGYDLRQASSPIIKEYNHKLDCLDGEEINEISFTTHSNNVHIATADDDGYARVSDHVPNRIPKIAHNNNATHSTSATQTSGASSGIKCNHLQHDSNGSGLVTSAAFRPRSKNLDLATGGTDCTVCLWDVNRPRRPSTTFLIEKDEEEGVNQICNPPIVHSLSWSPSGRLLAAGLGDGSTQIMQVEGRKLLDRCRLRNGHDSAVASVLFPQFGGVGSSHVVAEDRLMVSGGNDGSILLWDLGANLSSKAIDPSTMFADSSAENADGGDTSIDEAMEDLSIGGGEPTILFGMRHGKKPNWIVNSNASDPVLSNSLFIADTSNDITVYILPRS